MENKKVDGTILDELGFSEYWDEHGTWGGRTLKFKNGARFRIIVMENEDESGKYLGTDSYYYAPWFSIDKKDNTSPSFYFDTVSDIKECIKQFYPECVDEFNEIINNGK